MQNCADGEFRCDNGQCIDGSLYCFNSGDARAGCADRSHLTHCSKLLHSLLYFLIKKIYLKILVL